MKYLRTSNKYHVLLICKIKSVHMFCLLFRDTPSCLEKTPLTHHKAYALDHTQAFSSVSALQ